MYKIAILVLVITTYIKGASVKRGHGDGHGHGQVR